VLCVTALGESARTAAQHAYELAAGIQFAGRQYRSDIGHRAIKR
jgi:phosphoribosylamine--glycine ligase